MTLRASAQGAEGVSYEVDDGGWSLRHRCPFTGTSATDRVRSHGPGLAGTGTAFAVSLSFLT